MYDILWPLICSVPLTHFERSHCSSLGIWSGTSRACLYDGLCKMSEPASKHSDKTSSDDPGRVSVPVAECYTRFDSIRIHWQQRQQSLESGEVARIHDSILIGFFENQVLPGLNVNFSTPTSLLREAEPWLSDFFRPTGGFTDSLALYTKEPMKMATKLNDYIELMIMLSAMYSITSSVKPSNQLKASK